MYVILKQLTENLLGTTTWKSNWDTWFLFQRSSDLVGETNIE